MGRSKNLSVWCIIASTMVVMAAATMEADEKDCADQLANLATCIPFVSGTANKPTKICCDDAEKVRTAKPKCLCVLIKESTDPSIGLPINTTLALQMPQACNSDAKISDCPALLKMSPDSPEAKIFKDVDGGSTTTTASPATPASAGTPSSSSPATGSSSDSKPSSTTGDVAKLMISLPGIVGLASMTWMLI